MKLDPLVVAAAAARYEGADRFSRHFARGKLSGDPLYAGVLAPGVLPRAGLVVDLGCGRGLLLAALAAARPEGDRPRLIGVERRAARAEVARRALGRDAEIVVGDAATWPIPLCDAVTILDVLH